MEIRPPWWGLRTLAVCFALPANLAPHEQILLSAWDFVLSQRFLSPSGWGRGRRRGFGLLDGGENAGGGAGAHPQKLWMERIQGSRQVFIVSFHCLDSGNGGSQYTALQLCQIGTQLIPGLLFCQSPSQQQDQGRVQNLVTGSITCRG